MKRLSCPACGRPFLLSVKGGGTAVRCPGCDSKLQRGSLGLELVAEVPPSRRPRLERPKGAMVPVIAPAPAETAKNDSLLPPDESRDPVVGGNARGSSPAVVGAGEGFRWFLPLSIGGGGVAALAGSAVVVLVFSSAWNRDHGPAVDVSESTPLSSAVRLSPTQRAVPRGGAQSGTRSPNWTPQRGSAGDVTAAPRGSAATVADGDGDPIRAVLGSVAVVVMPGEGHGSGFVAAPGLLVTNHHVIEDAVIRDLEITFPDNVGLGGKRHHVELVHLSPQDDLAFLAIDADVSPLEIKAEFSHVNGQRVVAVGSPGSGGGPTLENLTTDGRLGPEVTFEDEGPRWALSMAVNGGNSGGPLLDAQTGAVLGVIAAKFTKTEAQSLAIPHGALVRELAQARQASDDDRSATQSLHRQRYCLRQMARLLSITSFSFHRSIEAALANSEAGGAGMDAAFNECKATAAAVFAEHFADFSSIVGGEVEALEADDRCDPRIRRGLRKLLEDIEEQADDIRRHVPRDEIGAFIGRFRGAVDGSRDLVIALAKQLQMQAPEDEEE